MLKSYRLIVFDWEGTLEDTSGQFVHTLVEEAERLQFGTVDEVATRQMLALGLRVAIKKLFAHLSCEQQEELLHAVQQRYADRPSEVYIMPGAEALIKRLQQAGLDLAIATNRGQQSLQRALQASGLAPFFQVTRCAGQVPAKPCPQMLEEIMDVFGADPAQTLMVGDSVLDMNMATLIHVDAVGFDLYHQQEQEKELLAAGALVVVNSFQQLANYLQL